jgi:hypothetical protein
LNVVRAFPSDVHEVEHCWIPLADGCRLAARLWLPRCAERSPVPAVVEYIPYGKRVGTRERDEAMHRWFAGHGYAAVRIDLRGSGESDGVLRDEYLPLEQEDGVEAIGWVAAQPWCNGAVGLMGKSWGGFNALQIAARRPPALRGILTVCSTDDRYADDVHYMGGCLLNDGLWWGATFFQLVAQPPDPDLVGESWREMWRTRLEAAEPHPLRWLHHPLRDDYWRQGSVCEDYAAIACPVYAVGGWADGYRNAIPRLLAGLRGPRRGLIGPWGHVYPHESTLGPPIGFLQEAVRWWDHTLRGVQNGIADEPAYRVWMPDSAPAGLEGGSRPGRWVAEAGWPTSRVKTRTLRLAPGRLEDRGARALLALRSPQTTGSAAGGWVVAGLRDQREDDARSLCFDSAPLEERLEILGAPEVRLVVASDRPFGFVAARLCDVAQDGSSTRITYGLRNLTHSPDHATWAPLEPGRRIEVVVRLNHIAHAIPAGHRLRLAVSTACWPLVWPSPEPVTLTVSTEGSRLLLPVRPADERDPRLPPFEPAARAPASEWTPVTKGELERRVGSDPATGDLVSRLRSGYDPSGRVAIGRCEPVDLEGGDGTVAETRIHPDDPLRARAAISQRSELRRGSWSVAVETEIRLSCTRTDFRLEASLRAFEGGARTFHRSWDERVARRGV